MLGLALYRMHEPGPAREAVRAARSTPLAHAVGLLLELTRFRVLGLLEAPPEAGPGLRALAWVRAWGLRWCGGAVAGSAALGAASAAMAPLNGTLALALAVLALGVPVAVLVRLSVYAGRILRAEDEPGLLLGMELLGAKAR